MIDHGTFAPQDYEVESWVSNHHDSTISVSIGAFTFVMPAETAERLMDELQSAMDSQNKWEVERDF